MSEIIKLLLVEDDPHFAEIIRVFLSKRKTPEIDVEHVGSLAAAQKRLNIDTDVVLLDLSLPDSRGLDTFYKVHSQAPGVPIIILTVVDDDKLSCEAVRRGAQDYLVKDQVDVKSLARVIRYAIERKRAEIAVKASEAFYRTLFETSMDCVFVIEKNGKWIHINDSGVAFLGYSSREELLKTNMNDFYINVRDRWDHLASIEKAGLSTNYEVALRRKDGKIVHALINAAPRKDGKTGMVIGYQGIITDITDRRRAEQLKDEFISMVSHEMRTPLTSIREGVSQVLEGILGTTTQGQKQFLSMTLEDIDRLRRIIDDLLDISKIEAGKVEIQREWVDLSRLVQGVAANFDAQARQKGIEIRTHCPENPVRMYVDRDKIIQVFTNLAGNALKFTQKGWVVISIEDKENYVTCTVSDSGRGIPEKDLPKIFNKFQQVGDFDTSVQKGTGLGLSIAKGIVELHSGRIHVQSRLGSGTSFIFRLPKYTARKWFRECVLNGFQHAISTRKVMSILVLEITGLKGVSGGNQLDETLRLLQETVTRDLRREGDIAVRDERSMLVMLPGTTRHNAIKLGERIRADLVRVFHKDLHRGMKINLRVAGYPGDGKTADKLLEAVQALEGIGVRS